MATSAQSSSNSHSSQPRDENGHFTSDKNASSSKSGQDAKSKGSTSQRGGLDQAKRGSTGRGK